MIRRLRLARSGATAAEFALTLPLMTVAIFAMLQLGMAFWANAGLQNGIGAAARTATLWPVRSDEEIRSSLTSNMFGVDSSRLSTPVLVRGTSGAQKFVDISVTYQTSFNMIFFTVPGFTFSHNRRAYIP